MSLFGPTIIGGVVTGAASAPAQGGSASGLTALALRVSPDGQTLEFQKPDGTWATTGLPLETAQDAAGKVVAVTIRP